MSELRIQFKKIHISRGEDGSVEAHVVLRWPDGDEFIGRGKDKDALRADLKSAAEATVNALTQAMDERNSLGLIAVEDVETMGSVLVLVSLTGYDQVYKLAGSCIVKEEPATAAALAVLDATNRLVHRTRPSREQLEVVN